MEDIQRNKTDNFWQKQEVGACILVVVALYHVILLG